MEKTNNRFENVNNHDNVKEKMVKSDPRNNTWSCMYKIARLHFSFGSADSSSLNLERFSARTL
ncbi:MAG: hypothetical protein M3250_00540 [Thermoproteota archaeon]|nr:hypothetical protein [Thermoproteota archaeon]